MKQVMSEFKIDRGKIARFKYYCSGNLYYIVEFGGNTYQFYINTTPEEVGSAIFNSEIKAISLLRYIRKCIDNKEFIRLSYDENSDN